MSKVYVIKNKKGKYYKLDSESLRDYYVENLIYAELYSEEHIKRFGEIKAKNIKWQEVTLCEGDLEKELAEKDKEIERLTKYASEMSVYNPNQKAIEELVKVQMYITDNAVYAEDDVFGREINDYIDERIKELKGE